MTCCCWLSSTDEDGFNGECESDNPQDGKTYHGDNHPRKPKSGFPGTPGTETRRFLNCQVADLRSSAQICGGTLFSAYPVIARPAANCCRVAEPGRFRQILG